MIQFLIVLSLTMGFSQEFFNEDPEGVGAFESSSIGRAILARGQSLTQSLKTKDELDRYFACHITTGSNGNMRAQNEARLREFNQNYRPMIELATQHFQIPYALAACVMFRESQFDNNAVSNRQAQGIAQFTAQTYDHLKESLNNVRAIEPHYQAFLKMDFDEVMAYSGTDNPYVRWVQFTQREGVFTNQVSEAERQNSINTSRALLNRFHIDRQLVGNLQTYLFQANTYFVRQSRNATDPSQQRSYESIRHDLFPNTAQGMNPTGSDLLPPSNFSTMLSKPMWVVAMNMFYLKQMMMNAQARFNRSQFENENDSIGFLMVIGGGYNNGYSRLNSTFETSSESTESVRQWCDRIGNNTETRNYMLSLRRCIMKNNFAQPTGQAMNPECQTSAPPENENPCAAPGTSPTAVPEPSRPSPTEATP